MSFLADFFGAQKGKTFKPVSDHKTAGRLKLHSVCRATLGSGITRDVVRVPHGEDENEWLAVHTVDFFNVASLLYGTVTEFCTPDSCPLMSAGPKYEYLWADGVKIKQPVKLSAPEYVDALMQWVDSQLNDQAMFPLEPNQPFPADFRKRVCNIFKRLFRVYAHIYCSHFPKVVALGAEAHMNTCFRHFVYFVQEFRLIEPQEMEPLRDLIDSLAKQ